MSDTGAFRALARYLDGQQSGRCTQHPGCLLRAGHAGPPRPVHPGTTTGGPR